MAIELVTTAAELRAESARLLSEKQGASQGLVPTMGALHEGHARLARTAVEQNDVVVASIFVNPLQFGEAVDLDRYPRTLEADMALLDAEGVDLVFAPSVEEVYPGGEPLVRVTAGLLGEKWEGASRPGHFDGALTVVAKLLHYGMPAAGTARGMPGAGLPAYRAYFGQKDAQQLALVCRMVADLNFPVEIVAGADCPLRGRDWPCPAGTGSCPRTRRGGPGAVPGPAADRGPRQRPSNRWTWTSAPAMVASQPLVELDYFDVVDPRHPGAPGGELPGDPVPRRSPRDHRGQGGAGAPDRQRPAKHLTPAGPEYSNAGSLFAGAAAPGWAKSDPALLSDAARE